MVLVAVFGVALLVAVLLSGLAARTVLSTSLRLLLGGALAGDGFLGLIHTTADSEIVSVTADLALCRVLFTDDMHVLFPNYDLLVLQADIPQGEPAYTLIAVCIAFSIVAHSSADVPEDRRPGR